MSCRWALPRAARLAAAVLSFREAHAATPMVKFLAGTYPMTDVNGGGSHSLTITVPGILAVFSIDGGAEQFSMSDVSAPAGFFNGNTGESPYFMSDDLFTVTWSTVFWPYVTFYPLSDQGGMTIGSSLGDTGDSNLLDTFAAPGSSQPFVIVGAPEPATWLTLALGFAGLAFLRSASDPRDVPVRRIATSNGPLCLRRRFDRSADLVHDLADLTLAKDERRGEFDRVVFAHSV